MRSLMIILLSCSLISPMQAQTFPAYQGPVIDVEEIFTESETRQLNSIIRDFEKRTTTQIAIVTLDERYTDKEHFDDYTLELTNNLGLGQKGKDNGILIAISAKFRQMRIQNGFGIETILSDEATKKIIDEQFIPAFKEGNYFKGTRNGLNEIICFLERAEQQQNYLDISDAFPLPLFKKIRVFVLENGELHTFRNREDKPWYNFTSLDVFLDPSPQNALARKDYSYEDYYEMTIRDSDGHHYQFVCFDKRAPGQAFSQQGMQVGKVYWLNPDDKTVAKNVLPLLAQIEDEAFTCHDSESCGR